MWHFLIKTWDVNLVLGAFSGHYMHLSLDFYTSLRLTPSRLFMAVSQVRRRRSTLSFFGGEFLFSTSLMSFSE